MKCIGIGACSTKLKPTVSSHTKHKPAEPGEKVPPSLLFLISKLFSTIPMPPRTRAYAAYFHILCFLWDWRDTIFLGQFCSERKKQSLFKDS